MKALKNIGIAILAIVALLLIVSFFLPSDVRVERSIVVNTPPNVPFQQVNDVHNWEKWSPWHKIDTTMQITYFGPENGGSGAGYSWTSEHKNVGNGSLTIMESIPNERITTELKFMEEEPGHGSWKFAEVDGGTEVTWAMDMHMGGNPIGKFFGLLMDGMLGPEFEKGLADIKKISEEMPAAPAIDAKTMTIPAQKYLTLRTQTTMEGIAPTLGESYGKLMGVMQANKIEAVGPPIAIYHAWEPEGVDVEAGIPVGENVEAPEGFSTTVLSGMVATTTHMGAYESMEQTYNDLQAWIGAQQNLEIEGAPWEVYITDPMAEPDTSKWATAIYFPVEVE